MRWKIWLGCILAEESRSPAGWRRHQQGGTPPMEKRLPGSMRTRQSLSDLIEDRRTGGPSL